METPAATTSRPLATRPLATRPLPTRPVLSRTALTRRAATRPVLTRAPAAELAVAALAILVFTWRIDAPSPWRDEAVTATVARRSVAQIMDLTGSIDRVHLVYYLLVHAAEAVHPSLSTARLLSAAALVVTAVLLVRLGRLLDSPALGTLSALLLLCSPLVSRYAQEARPYPLVMMTATAATVALLSALRRPDRRLAWVGYAVLLVATVVLNVLALVLLLPHALFVLLVHRTATRHWAAAVAVALVPSLAWAWVTQKQAQQVGWLVRPSVATLGDFFDAAFDPTALIVVIVLAGVVTGPRRPCPAVVLGALWAFAPPLALWSLSQVHPLFTWRYVVLCLPGLALLVAACLRGIGRRLGRLRVPVTLAVVVALVVGGAHMQTLYRDPSAGHAEDVRGAAAYVGAHATPGDAVLFMPDDFRIIALAYPADFRGVDDVALDRDAVGTATLTGRDTTAGVLAQRMAAVRRVWVVSGPHGVDNVRGATDRTKAELLREDFTAPEGKTFRPFLVSLYQRSGTGDPFVGAVGEHLVLPHR